MLRFSVIIPVYNVEPYLKRCVDSVLQQSFQDYEVILVDDGSPDNSGKMCDEYARQNSHVKVIHKKNGGLSDARNVGIKAAVGEYVLFLDSDDYWSSSNNLTSINSKINQETPDVVIYSVSKQFSSENIKLFRGNYFDDFNLNKNEIIDRLIATNNYPCASWIFCVKKDLIIRNNLFFPLDVTAEDFVWILNIVLHCHNIALCNNAMVIYNQSNPTSITSNSSIRGSKGTHIALDFWQTHKEDKWPQKIELIISKIYLIELMNYYHLNNDDKLEAYGFTKSDSQILKEIGGIKNYVIWILINCIGINYTSRILRYLYLLWKTIH